MICSWEFGNSAAGRVLKAIQARGHASIKEVAADLGVTSSAVRLHVAQLHARGLVIAQSVREGVGRPYYLYSAGPSAYELLHNDYGDLTRLVLEEVAGTQGSAALQAVLRRVSDRLADLYKRRIGGLKLSDRVHSWAELLERRGVAVKVVRTDQGFLLEEYGCPYHAVAIENRAVCELERQVMARLLESGVQLTQCVLDGHRGCQFSIAS